MAALNDVDPTICLEAIKGLGHCGTNGAPAVTQLIQFLSGTNVLVQEQACLALGRIGAPAREGISAVSPLVQSENNSVRMAATVALAALKQTP